MIPGDDLQRREEYTRIAVNFSREGDAVIAQVSGELDFGTVRQFNEKMETLIKAGVQNFVIDVSAILYMDSSGIASLIKEHRNCMEADGRLVVVWPRDKTIRTAIERTRIATKMNFRESIEDAMNFLQEAEAEEAAGEDPSAEKTP